MYVYYRSPKTGWLQKSVVAAGERESTIVHYHDLHGDYFKSPMKLKFTLDLRPRVSERPLNYSFVDHINGTYTTMFIVYVSRSYTFIIRLFGLPIKNNPYQFAMILGKTFNCFPLLISRLLLAPFSLFLFLQISIPIIWI